MIYLRSDVMACYVVLSSGTTGDVYLQSSASDDDETETDPLKPSLTHMRQPITVDNLWNYVRERRNPKSTDFKDEYDVRQINFLSVAVRSSIIYLQLTWCLHDG